MKKTLTINLWGQVYHIDEDAYQILQNYLTKLENQFAGTEEGKEILGDVEARFAEIFKERLGTIREVVNMDDVDYSISIIGTPEDFGVADENKVEAEPENKKEKKSKRLFRNPDDRILGGVCSGLAAYFSIDPVIVRIIMVITFFFSGPLIYLVLWIVIPEAKTTAQKLEMRGEPVNLSNIEKNIKEEFGKVKDNLTSNKSKSRARHFANHFGDVILSILKVFFRIFTVSLGIIFILIGTAFLVAFTVGVFFEGSSNISFTELTNTFIDNSLIVPGLIGLCLVFCIPVISLIITGVRFIFGIRNSFKYLNRTLAFTFLFGIILVTFVAVNHFLNFRYVSNTNQLIAIDSIKTKTLVVNISDSIPLNNNLENNMDFDKYLLLTSENECNLYGKTALNIKISNDSTVKISDDRQCRSSSKRDGNLIAKNIPSAIRVKDSIVSITKYFEISKEAKFHVQQQIIILHMPVNSQIFINKNVEEILNNVEISGNYSYSDIVGKTCKMTSSGLEPILN